MLVGHGQAQAVSGDHAAFPPPVAEQVAHQVLDGPGAVRVQCLDPGIELGIIGFHVQHRRPPRHPSRAVVDQPVADRQRGADVVLVVPGDALQARAVAVAHPVLVLDDRAGAAVDVVGALVAGEPLDVLQSVGLHADLQGAGDDRVQVDEQPAGDEGFDLLFDDAMRFGQALQGASFRVVVVVHVHVRERLEPSAQVVHQRDDRCGLPGAVVRPERPVDPLPGVAFDQPEQEEQPDVGLPERVALIVQEHVPLIRLRERGEPPQDRLREREVILAGTGVVRTVRGEDLERRRVGRSQASLLLQRGLAMQLRLTHGVEPWHRVVQMRQASERLHSVGSRSSRSDRRAPATKIRESAARHSAWQIGSNSQNPQWAHGSGQVGSSGGSSTRAASVARSRRQ